MTNISAAIKSIRNIMRNESGGGISGDAQRLEQLGWMLFLKIMDDKDMELEITKDDYRSVIPDKFQWRNWAKDPAGITGDALLDFINNDLFPALKNLGLPEPNARQQLVREVFEGNNNYFKSGYGFRKVVNKLEEINFNDSKDKQVFGTIYETILQELRDAGNKGEFYTPRAITQLMTEMTDPKLKESVLDPAAGTGGFLTAAIDHVRAKYVRTVEDEHLLQESITGWEYKPVAHVLGLTNLIIHEMEVPDYHFKDSLKTDYNSIGKKQQVDVILANPPFGAGIEEGVETNFPKLYRCKESADLFVLLMMQLLKPHGRAAIVLPDGSITGEGVKARIRERLLTTCNLHTIVRLPQSTFFPATVATNLLFFEKGSPTKDIWYYEHRLPEGQKSYSKTKPIQYHEFAPLIKWWSKREENEVAWKVNVNELKDWDLDVKNPHVEEEIYVNPEVVFQKYSKGTSLFNETLDSIIKETSIDQHPTLQSILSTERHLFRNRAVVKLLKQSILQEAIEGKLTADWRKENPDVKPASELLKRIKAEKARLIKEKKLKKEKPLPPIAADEIPFELPDGWEWCRLYDMCSYIQRGKSPKYSPIKKYPVIAQKCVQWHGLEMFKAQFIDPDTLVKYAEERILKTGDLLWNSTGKGSLGRIGIYDESVNEYELAVADSHVTVIRPFKSDFIPQYVFYYLAGPTVQSVIDSQSTGSTNQTELATSTVKQYPIPLPPITEQQAIVEKVESLLEKCRLLEAEITQSEQHAQQLMQAVLKEAFEGGESALLQAAEPKAGYGKVIQLPRRKCQRTERPVLAGHIILRCASSDFGRTKLMKLLYLVEQECDLDLETEYLQYAAGPYDETLIRDVEQGLQRFGLFNVSQNFKSEKKEVTYIAKSAAQVQLEPIFSQSFSVEAEKINALLDKFRNKPWYWSEIIATLYAVWNNRILLQQPIEDTLLKQDFLNWSEGKARYKNQLDEALLWMRRENIQPKGWGKMISSA